MPLIIDPKKVYAPRKGDGWSVLTLADGNTIGAPAMAALRWSLEPHARSPEVRHGENEEMLYVIAGSGQAQVGPTSFELEPESLLWLEPGDRYILEAGAEGLEVLQSYAPGI
jgi:quercetin dioxygenase-like cupin family protein